MRVLLDTHAFLWSYSETRRLSKAVAGILMDPDTEVFVSAVGFWEIALKVSIGKLKPVGKHPSDLIRIAESLRFVTIPLSVEEASTYGDLTEETHLDPFDRMLIWQAISRELTLISSDAQFKRFIPDGLKLFW